jgi:hypothetical protein
MVTKTELNNFYDILLIKIMKTYYECEYSKPERNTKIHSKEKNDIIIANSMKITGHGSHAEIERRKVEIQRWIISQIAQ